MSGTFFAVATMLLLMQLCGAHHLRATVSTFPNNSTIDCTRTYQSSNSDIVWLQTPYPGPPSQYYFFGYDPVYKYVFTPNGIAGNTANRDHVDQLYYDASSGLVIAQMETHIHGGIGHYYPNGYTINNTLVWSNKTFVIQRNLVGGFGVAGGAIVLQRASSLGAGFYTVVGANSSTGEALYSFKYVQQLRCNPTSAVCVAVIVYPNGTANLMGFDSVTGAKAWVSSSFSSTASNISISDVYQWYLVIDNVTVLSHVRSRVDTITGDIVTLGTVSSDTVSFHQHGGNLIRHCVGATHIRYEVVSIASGELITEIVIPSNETSGVQLFANYQVVLFAVVGPSATHATLWFFDADTGLLLSAKYITWPNMTGLGYGPFLVGSKLVLPSSQSSYEIVFPGTRRTIMASYLVSQLTNNIIYLPSGTLMWNPNELIQFEKE